MDTKAILANPVVIATGWTTSPIPVFVMFGADWCSYCVKQKPVVLELKQEYGDKVRFEILNTDDNAELKAAFGVKGIPAMFILGQSLAEIDHCKGLQTKRTLKRRIDKALAG